MPSGSTISQGYIAPGAVGAKIVERTNGAQQPPSGVGDSVLINLCRGVFAVADSPDSNPAASREFLHAFDSAVEDLASRRPGLWNGQCDVGPLKKSVSHTVNRLIERVDYRSSTTFSCIMCLKVQDNVAALMFHSGDSCIFKVNTVENSIEQVSRSSIDFVGRTDKLSQVESVEVQHDTRFVLCSDGLQALVRNPGNRTLRALLLETVRHPEVHEIPDLLMERYVQNLELPDDLAIIVLDPHKLSFSGETIVLGGEVFGPSGNPR